MGSVVNTPRRIITAGTAALLAVVLATVVAPGIASATTLTPLSAASFTGTSVPVGQWTLPTASGGNQACLTAGPASTSTSVVNCSPTSDVAGSGALQLTTNGNNQVGSVFNTTSLPTSQGLDVTFNAYQFLRQSTRGADGISFTLAAANPADPIPPTTSGPTGGSLGYSTAGGNSGLPYGYLGIGFDVFGNYLNPQFGGSTCTPGNFISGTQYPQSVTIRGPGNGTSGYCLSATSANTTSPSGGAGGNNLPGGVGALDNPTATTHGTSSVVPVEIALNPASTPTTTPSGLSVPANSYVVEYTPVGGTAQTVTQTLPSLVGNTFGIPSSWYNPTTGVPYQLTFGWNASTGGSNEYHEVNTLASSTVNGPLPSLLLNETSSGFATQGSNTNSLTLTPSLVSAANGGADETNPITVTDVFPAGLVPGTPSGTNWNCSASSGQTVSCTYTGGTVTAGSSYPPITVPFAVPVSTALGSYSDNARVSSIDALPITSSTTLTVSGPVSLNSRPIAATPDGKGYWVMGQNGAVLPFGDAVSYGSMAGKPLNKPIVGIAATPDGNGYWLGATDGGIFTFGDAGFYGSLGNKHLNQPILGITATPDGKGYWMVASDGGIFTFGDAGFYGSRGHTHLNKPIVGMASTPDGKGYWLAAADGGVFSFGDATFYGSRGGQLLNAPVDGIAADISGNGYWLVAQDGGVFTYGDAAFYGSRALKPLNQPVTGMAATPTGAGYWLAAADGGVFTYGDAGFYGAATGKLTQLIP